MFHCYAGNSCFLAEIRPETGDGINVSMTKTEKALDNGDQRSRNGDDFRRSSVRGLNTRRVAANMRPGHGSMLISLWQTGSLRAIGNRPLAKSALPLRVKMQSPEWARQRLGPFRTVRRQTTAIGRSGSISTLVCSRTFSASSILTALSSVMPKYSLRSSRET